MCTDELLNSVITMTFGILIPVTIIKILPDFIILIAGNGSREVFYYLLILLVLAAETLNCGRSNVAHCTPCCRTVRSSYFESMHRSGTKRTIHGARNETMWYAARFA
ncbi:hypothetical protein RvY_14225-4 [Ramazzottius varieornatus]|uniref:Uncharacterized protein n=1 Tax=Ramazzottius varieornatus TaxID=947166 RepID=A0A1D1VUG5_RAMVA|nr:hypothetical protein RvY_14225-4 [Ramazzottius varieornatus]